MRKDYWLLFGSQVINRFGEGFYFLSLSWLVFQLTNSPLALGGMWAMNMAVVAVVQAFGSPLADRLDRRRLMIALDLARGCLTAVPAILWQMNVLEPWHVYLILITNGVLGTPYKSVGRSLLPSTVDPDRLEEANAWLEGATEAMYLVGPTVAGFILAWFGATPALLVDSAALWLAAGLTANLQRSLSGARIIGPREPYVQALVGGWRILSGNKTLAPFAMLLTTVALTDTVFVALVVPYVNIVLHGTSIDVGLLEASLSGGIVGASIVATRSVWHRWPIVLWLSVPTFCLATGALAMAPNFAWAVGLQLLAGMATGVFNIRAQIRFQQLVCNEQLGRTLMVSHALRSGAQAAGAVLAGSLAASFGVPIAFLAFGIGGTVISGLIIGATQFQARSPA